MTKLTIAEIAAIYIPPPSEIGRPAYQYAYRKRGQVYAALRTMLDRGMGLPELMIVGYSGLPALHAELRRRLA